MDGVRLEEKLHQVGGELADGGGSPFRLKNGISAAADIHRHKPQRLVQRDIGVPHALDAAPVAQCLVECLPQHNPHILNGVMAVNVQIAHCLHRQIKQAMHGEGGQHVVEKADTGRNLGLTCAVQVDGQMNICLFCLPMNRCDAFVHNLFYPCLCHPCYDCSLGVFHFS